MHVSTSSGSLLSPTTEQSDGQIPRQAKYKWIKEMLEAYPRLKNLSEGAEIEIFEEMSGDHIQRFIAASFSLYPNIQGFDINTFKLLFRTLKTISVRGDEIFTRALGVMSCAHDPKERLLLYGAMGISIDDMNNTEYKERLSFAEKYARKSSQCFYLFAILAMTKPIEEVRKNC